jgi:protocadherin Fat 1/2/3
MTTSTYVLITLLDVNDNPPEFELNIYECAVSESLPIGNIVMRVFASSRDIGINAEIEYSVIGGNEQAMFDIDPQTGTCYFIKLVEIIWVHLKIFQMSKLNYFFKFAYTMILFWLKHV